MLTSRISKLSFSTFDKYIKLDNPYNSKIISNIKLLTNKDIDKIIKVSDNIYNDWKNSKLDERIELINKWISIVELQKDKIARETSLSMGKPLKQSYNEIQTMITRAKTMVELAPEALGEKIVQKEPLFKSIIREPVGVVAVLSPWNYPLICAVNAVIPALLAGNSVVLKHSDRSPLTTKHFVDTFEAAGAPKGLIQGLFMTHEQVPALIKNESVGYVAFTGSVAGGREVYRTVGRTRFIDVGLELGGKDAAYVSESADPAQAAAALVDGAMYNAGQSCCSVERVYVHKSIYTAFLDAAVAEAKHYVLGDPLKEGTTMGPIAQPKHGKFLEKQVQQAVSRGAKLLLGGSTAVDSEGLGRFFAPTVLANCNQDMDVMTEETFGPILAVTMVDSDEEAVAKINDSKYGLTAAVYTADQAHAMTIGKQLNVGTVFMNRCDFVDPSLPWSGRKDSGKGITLSQFGFEAFTRTKGFNFRVKL